MRVKVWRNMIIEIHTDNDTEEATDFWHGSILYKNYTTKSK